MSAMGRKHTLLLPGEGRGPGARRASFRVTDFRLRPAWAPAFAGEQNIATQRDSR